MSKKKEIVELLEQGTDVEEICTDLGVSTSYVYRIKREMEESKGDKKESDDSEKDNADGVVIDSTSGNSLDVEGDNKNLEEKKGKRETDKSDRMGGVKKRRKRVKKEEKEEEEKEEEDNGGLIKWIKKKWKQMLLILTLSILLIITTLMPYLMKPKEPIQSTWEAGSRFPIIKH